MRITNGGFSNLSTTSILFLFGCVVIGCVTHGARPHEVRLVRGAHHIAIDRGHEVSCISYVAEFLVLLPMVMV